MIILLSNQVAPGNVEKRRVTQQPTPGQELEDNPDGFDSREVLLGQSTQSACFVIKDVSQILPYCVINLTRHTQTRMSGSLRMSSPSVTMRNLSGSSLPGPSSAQPANTAGPSSSAAFPTFTSSPGRGLSGPQLPPSNKAGPSSSGTSLNTNIALPWPPRDISFLPGKYCRIVRNGNAYNAVVTNPHLKTNANTEQIIKALCLLQNIVIQKLPSKPDLLANTRLKTIFMFSIQSDMIFAPFPVIKKLNEELVQFFR